MLGTCLSASVSARPFSLPPGGADVPQMTGALCGEQEKSVSCTDPCGSWSHAGVSSEQARAEASWADLQLCIHHLALKSNQALCMLYIEAHQSRALGESGPTVFCE